MRGLIGAIFLKRFFGDRWQHGRVHPSGEALTDPENAAGIPAGSGCPPEADLPNREVILEIGEAGDIDKIAGPAKKPDRPASEVQPLAVDKKEFITEKENLL